MFAFIQKLLSFIGLHVYRYATGGFTVRWW